MGVVIVSFILFCVLMLVIPEILELIDSLAGSFGGGQSDILT